MPARNTKHGYGWISRSLHWLMALAVFGMFGLGWWMRGLDYYHPWYQPAPELHISIGIVLIAALCLRLIWKTINPKPAHISNNKLENRLATLVHIALYSVLILLMCSGYIYATAEGRPADVFGLFDVPALSFARNLKGFIGWVHEYLAYAIMALAALHVVAALKHHFVDRDDTLRRMIRNTPDPTN